MIKHRGVVLFLAVLLVPSLAFAGNNVFIEGHFGSLNAKAGFDVSAKAALQSVLMSELGAMGDEELFVARSHVDAQGGTHVRFHQSYNGLRVVGADMYVHADAAGNIVAINGSYMRGGDVAFSPAIAAPKALSMALGKAGIAGERLDRGAELVYVLDADGKGHLAWQATVSYVNAEGPQVDRVFASASNGKLVAKHPQHHYARVLRTYDCNNGTSCGSLASSSSNPINTGDPAIDDAHNYAISTYDYFSANHGRDSLDDAGMTLRSRVHYSNNYNNAFWDGTQMTYGDGDGTTFIALSRDADVVAHELTHGVTSNSSNLIYSNESGALNEAMSDIFGAMVDRQEGANITDTWLLGEDIYTPGTPGDGLRVMDDPQAAGDYDYYPTRYTGSQDNGGVHWNSGIANLAFVLMVEGGTHPRGTTSNNVPALNGNFDTAMGMAAAIFYDANNNCLTASSNFQAARNCTEAAALSIYGTAAETSVREAWDAVGVPGGGGGGGGGGSCSGSPTNIWTGTASSGTPNLTTPNCSGSGTFNGELVCDNGAADLDLYLEKESCSGWFGCSFGSVASSTSAGCDEAVSGYSGSSGTYRWRINWYSGPAEPFQLCTNQC